MMLCNTSASANLDKFFYYKKIWWIYSTLPKIKSTFVNLFIDFEADCVVFIYFFYATYIRIRQKNAIFFQGWTIEGEKKTVPVTSCSYFNLTFTWHDIHVPIRCCPTRTQLQENRYHNSVHHHKSNNSNVCNV